MKCSIPEAKNSVWAATVARWAIERYEQWSGLKPLHLKMDNSTKQFNEQVLGHDAICRCPDKDLSNQITMTTGRTSDCGSQGSSKCSALTDEPEMMKPGGIFTPSANIMARNVTWPNLGSADVVTIGGPSLPFGKIAQST